MMPRASYLVIPKASYLELEMATYLGISRAYRLLVIVKEIGLEILRANQLSEPWLELAREIDLDWMLAVR